MMKKRIFLLLAMGFALSSLPLEAQNWRNTFQQLRRDGKNDEALRLIWSQTLRNPQSSEHVERARVMQDLGLPILAIREWADAVRSQPSSTVAAAGFGEAALVWDRLGSVNSVVNAMNQARIPIRNWPASLRLAAALNAHRSGSVQRVRQLLPNTSDLRQIQNPEARLAASLHLSALQWAMGQPAQALQSLESVLGAERRIDLATHRLQAARLLYDMNRFSQSLQQLTLLPRNAGSWHSGVLVGAWSAYRLGDYNLTLGQLLTLHSPYLETKFAPETYVLEASTLFQLCHFTSARKSLDRLREKYRGVLSSITRFSNMHTDSSARVDAVLSFARGNKARPAGVNSLDWTLMMDGFLQEDALLRADRILLQTDAEEKYFNQIFPRATQPLVQSLRNRYESEFRYARLEAYRDAVRSINRKMRSMREDVETAFENASLVELEVNTQIRRRLIEERVPEAVSIDFRADVRRGFEFWPFEGEFWRDEVGSYAFATTHVCGERDL